MNRLERYLPLSAMKLMYDSLILSHLQFGITNWDFEWDRISKLQKRALRIMTNSRYNSHTEPLFKQLHLLNSSVKDIFEIQCLKFWYKYVNNKLPNYIRNMATPTGGEAAQGGLVQATCELSFRNEKIILGQNLRHSVRYILLCL